MCASSNTLHLITNMQSLALDLDMISAGDHRAQTSGALSQNGNRGNPLGIFVTRRRPTFCRFISV